MIVTDKSYYSEYSFVLNYFSPIDIDMIASDLEMSFNGYHFLYIIDTYDIVENYMPYTDFELFTKRDINNQAQKYICYDYFFGSFNKTDSILMNEYKIELLAAKNKLNRHLREAKNVLSNLETLKKETNQFINNPEKTEFFFRNNFEIILLLLILNDKTYSILDEFFSFIRTRLHVSEVKGRTTALTDADSDLLNSIFTACTHTHFSVELFEKYINENKLKLLSVDNYEERHVFLENTFRDIQVIERILRINDTLAQSGLKYYAIYLSSAHKTSDIFRVLDKMPLNPYNRGNGKSKKFHRNVYQYFLYDRIQKEYKNRPSEAFEIIHSLKNLVCKISVPTDNTAPSDRKEKDVLKVVKELFDERSGAIDNHFYLSVYEKYKSTFRTMSDQTSKEKLNQKEVLKIIKEIDKNKEKQKDRVFNLDFTLSQLNQAYNIVDSYQSINDYEPDYRYGKDIIKNPYQHLPTLLLIDQKYSSELKLKLYDFLNRSIEIKEPDKNVLRVRFQALVNELPKISSEDISSKMLKSLIVTYINFIAQPKLKNAKAFQNSALPLEEAIIIDLEKQYEITKLSFEKIDHIRTFENNKLEIVVTNTDLLTEISYILIWLYRRNNREDDGIIKGKESLTSNKMDPRICQGIALCYVSKVYKLLKQNDAPAEIQKHIDHALQYLRLSKEKFHDLINKNTDLATELLIMKNYIAIQNSLADIYIRKYEIEQKSDPAMIETARSCINEIKYLFDTINLIYDEHPTYSATEFEIEYYEALILYEANEISKAHNKVINALSRIDIFNNSRTLKETVDELFLQKQSALRELATTIFKHYSKK